MIFTLADKGKISDIIDKTFKGIGNIVNPQKGFKDVLADITDVLHNGFIHTKDTLNSDLKDIFTGIKNGISNGIDTIKTKKGELADNIKTNISDFLGFNSESVGKWRKDLADTANRVNINRASKYSKKRFATQSTAHEKIKEYNSYLEKLKSGDDIISQQANENINTLINNLKGTNSELAEFIEQRRKAAEEATAEGESTVYEELSSEDYMESQRESIRNLLDNDGIRATIDQYRALGNATGQVSEQQRVMIAGIRERDEAFANFLEQNPAATMGQYARAQVVATAKTIALELATSALNSAISFGISFILTTAISAITAYIRRYDDMRKANLEVAESFKKTTESIEEQKNKIKELYDVINDKNSTDNEIYDAKSELLDIQREIVDTYGEQAKNIDIVNGKLEEEIAKLDEIRQKEAKNAYDKSYGSYEDSKKTLEKKKSTAFDLADVDVYAAYNLKGTDLEKQIKELGFTIDGSVVKLTDLTTLEDIEKYQSLMDILGENNEFTQDFISKFKEVISGKINELDTDDYQSALTDVENTSWAAINKSAYLYGKYTEIEDAINKFDEALKSGDKTGAENQLEIINNLRNEIETMEFDDEYIRQHFMDALDVVQNDLDKRSLKIDLETKVTYHPIFGFSENGARGSSPLDYFRNAFDGYSDIDVKNIGLINGTAEEEEAYANLKKMADKYEVSLEDIIDTLVELGVIYSRDADAAKYTVTNYASMLESVESLTESLDKFDSAQLKVITGSSLTADEINELIKLYPELISCIERTATGYTISAEKIQEARDAIFESEKANLKSNIEKSRTELKDIQKEIAENQAEVDRLSALEVRTPDQERQLTVAKNKVTNRKEDEKNKKTEIEQEVFLFNQLSEPIEDWASALDDVAGKFETIKDKILNMRTETAQMGTIDPQSALDFIKEVDNWQDYLSFDDNGNAVLKKMSNDELVELIKTSTGYNAVLDRMNNSINENITKRDQQQAIVDEVNNKLKTTGQITQDDAKRLGAASSRVSELNVEITDANETLAQSIEFLKTWFGLFESSDAVNTFNGAVEDLDYKLEMGLISQDKYDEDFSSALKTLKENAAENDYEAQQLIKDSEIKEHNATIAGMQRDYDDEKTLLDNQLEDKLISYLTYQKELAALNEKYYAPGTDLGNDEDGKKQYAENLREISKLSKDAYDDLITRLDSAVDYGTIIDPNLINDIQEAFGGEIPAVIQQSLQKALSEGTLNEADILPIVQGLGEALLTGADLNDAIVDYKSKVISAYEYEVQQLEQDFEDGLISSSELIDGLTERWRKYYKDKKEFAEEDKAAQRSILEAQKNQIQEQIDALEAYSETQTEPYQAEIDALNEVKDKYSEVMDEKIDALQKQKDALDKINEEQERENDLLEKKKALEKASIKNRIVLTSNGWEARRDEEAYNEAKKEYEDAKKTEQTELLEQQIEALQNEKEAREKSIDREITAREDAISKIEAPINNLTKVLAALIAEQHNIDPKFIADALSSKSGQDAIDILNRELGFSQQQEAQYGVDVPNDLLTVDDARDIAKDAATNNKTTDEYAAGLGLSLGEAVTDANQKAIDELLAEYNKLVANRKAKGSDYEFEGHIGKVDYNNRPINLNEDDYNTLLGTTLSYESIANMFDEYLKDNNIESEELWNICEALWDIVETNENMHFNVSPLRPDGTAITNLNGNDDQFFGGIYDYILSQLTSGIRLEDMDIFMGGNYASGDEADRAAQEAHNDSARIYDLEADILRRLIALGYDVNKLDGVKYTGEIPVQANNNNKNSAASNTQHAADNTDLNTNTTSTDKNTEALNDLTAAITGTDNNTTEAGTVTAGGFNLVADPETGKFTKKPIMVGDKQIEGQKIRAVTKSEWEKKHDKNEWSPNNKNIVPLDSLDMSFITDSKLLGFVNAARNWTSGIKQGMINIPKTADIAATSLVQPTSTVGAPVFNCNITVEGNADKKTVQAFKTELHNELCEYTDQLYNSLHNSFIRQKNKK